MRTLAVVVFSLFLCTWSYANDDAISTNDVTPELIEFYMQNYYVNLGDEAAAADDYETALTGYATLIAISEEEKVDPQLLLRAYRGAGRIYMKYAVNDRAAECFKNAEKIEPDPEIQRLLQQISSADKAVN